MKIKQMAITAVCATSGIFSLWSPLLVADDTEIYHGSEDVTGAVPPNILLLLDTSGSMESTYEEPRTEYDPGTPYPGTDKYGNTCQTDRIYWSNGDDTDDLDPFTNGDPSAAGCGYSESYFRLNHFNCQSATAALNTSGFYYSKYFAEYLGYLSSGSRRWDNPVDDRSSTRPADDAVYQECKEDEGVHGKSIGFAFFDTTPSSPTYLDFIVPDSDAISTSISFGSGGAPWRSTSAFDWTNTDLVGDVTLYHPNYMRYLYGYEDLNNNSTYDAGEGYADPVVKVYIEVLQEIMLQLLENWHGMKVGIARYNGDEGGSILYPVVPIDESDNRRQLQQTICNLWNNSICNDTYGLINGTDLLGAGTPHTEALYEAFNYFRGHRVEYGDQSYAYRQSAASTKRPGNTDFYDSPVEYTCQFNAIVHMTDGRPTYNGDASGTWLSNPSTAELWHTRDVDTAIKNLPSFGSLPSADTSCEGDGDVDETDGITPDSCMDELAEYMANVPQDVDLLAPDGTFIQSITAQPIRTYTIGFDIDLPYLQDTASKGKGRSFTAESVGQMRRAFDEVVSEIVQTGTAFVSPPGVAVQAQARTRHLNTLIFNLFQPLESPHYEGNLKRYEIAVDTDGNPVIVDFDRRPAVDPDTGGFADNARSWWSVDEDGVSPINDGNDVVKGGARSQLEPVSFACSYLGGDSKSICASANLLSQANMINGEITAEDLMLPPDRVPWLHFYPYWAAGFDIFDDDGDGNYTNFHRNMGDPLHAQPTLVTYDSDKNDDEVHIDPDVLIFTMTNDGFLHAFELETGDEAWRFMPKELFPNVYKAHSNIGSGKLYGLDGQFLAWTYDHDDNGQLDVPADHAWLFFGMRRGGRNYYALDISSKTDPQYMWDIKGGVTPGFEHLGQTWGQMQKATINLNGVEEEVLVFTGGYDENQDDSPTTMPDATMGNAIYMVRASDGTLLWHASNDADASLPLSDMKYPIPAEPAVLDMNLDGYHDRMYIADISGQVWRMDIHNGAGSASSLVTAGLVAKLGESGGINNRRFFNAPDVAFLNDDGHGSAVVINIGSGNRDDPLGKEVEDRLFSFRDPNGSPTGIVSTYVPPLSDTDLKDVTNIPESNVDAFFAEVMTLYKGWYIKLPPSGSMSGEKALAPAITLDGQVLFTTYEPPTGLVADGCELPTGTTRIYSVSLRNGRAVVDVDEDGTIEDTDDRSVETDHEGIASGIVVLFPEATDGAPVAMSGNKIMKTKFKNKLRRSYWYTPERNPAE